mmetsp:Transcript_28967/g.53013  ORF Transcript_28967/g.53013 Transcript_28967/m.53013 type:complete len:343 (-) Transcript_28967:694-1722(-)
MRLIMLHLTHTILHFGLVRYKRSSLAILHRTRIILHSGPVLFELPRLTPFVHALLHPCITSLLPLRCLRLVFQIIEILGTVLILLILPSSGTIPRLLLLFHLQSPSFLRAQKVLTGKLPPPGYDVAQLPLNQSEVHLQQLHNTIGSRLAIPRRPTILANQTIQFLHHLLQHLPREIVIVLNEARTLIHRRKTLAALYQFLPDAIPGFRGDDVLADAIVVFEDVGDEGGFLGSVVEVSEFFGGDYGDGFAASGDVAVDAVWIVAFCHNFITNDPVVLEFCSRKYGRLHEHFPVFWCCNFMGEYVSHEATFHPVVYEPSIPIALIQHSFIPPRVEIFKWRCFSI